MECCSFLSPTAGNKNPAQMEWLPESMSKFSAILAEHHDFTNISNQHDPLAFSHGRV